MMENGKLICCCSDDARIPGCSVECERKANGLRWRRARAGHGDAAAELPFLVETWCIHCTMSWCCCGDCVTPACLPAWHWRCFCSAWWDMMITKLHYIFAAFPHTHTEWVSPHFHFHFSVEWSALYFCIKTNPIFRSKTTLLPIVCYTTCTATPYPKLKF